MSFIKHIKGDTYSVHGTQLTVDYINRITIPTLLDALLWSPMMVLNALENAQFPYTRHYKLTEALNEREAAKEQAEREAREQAERIASMYPDPKKVAKERAERERIAASIREHGQKVRAANSRSNKHHRNEGENILYTTNWD